MKQLVLKSKKDQGNFKESRSVASCDAKCYQRCKEEKSPNNLGLLLTLTSRSAREVLCAAVGGDMTERDLRNWYIALSRARNLQHLL